MRMLQLSLLFGRIAHRGRIVATQAAFVSPQRHKIILEHTQKAECHAIAAASLNPDEDSVHDEDVLNQSGSRRYGNVDNHQSRLASIYDEMFADDTDSDQSTPVEQKSYQQRDPEQPFLSQEALEKEMDFDLDNDYPAFPQEQGNIPKISTPSIQVPPRPAPRNVPSRVKMKAQTPVPFLNDDASSSQLPSTKSAIRSFPQNKSKPPKARMMFGRIMPPSVMEYDNSHYDEEFGAPQYGENEIPEFHDGMLEELIQAEATRGNAVQPSIIDFDDEHEGVSEKENVPSSPPRLDTLEIAPIKTNDNSNEGTRSDPIELKKKVERPFERAWAPQAKPPPRPTNKVSVSTEALAILKGSADGNGATSQADIIQHQMLQTQAEIYKLNNDQEFNINSPKQVSMALFGVDNESTNKAALEALAGNISNTGGNANLASLILQYRKYKRDLKRAENREVNKANGTHVSTVGSMRDGKDEQLVQLKEPVKPSSVVAFHNGDFDNVREPLVLIDASAYIFRAYYSMPPMHRYDGEPTGATLGFCNMLNKLILTPMLKGEQPRVVLVFDSKEGGNFRKKLYAEYKSNRNACPEDLIPQFDFVRDAADAYGICQLEAPGYEADDVIATLSSMAVKEGCHVNILSGDKDLMQLVTKDDGGACIEMIDPMKMIRYSHAAVTEKWGVEPHQVGDVLGLAGDSADNIPGVPGIGPKIAASLINDFGSLEALLENLDDVKQKGRREKLKENIHMARLSRQLVELERNVPIEDMSFPSHLTGVSDLRMEKLDPERLVKFYERMGFRDLKKRFKSRIMNDARRTLSSTPQMTDKYSAIMEITSTSTQEETSAKSVGNGFSKSRSYRSPPKPEDYLDVPF